MVRDNSQRAYIVFHLNLAYSSIPESARESVIEKCYWPILRLIETGIPVAIEAPGYTLEEIARIDNTWIEKFRALLLEGKTELVGSGYMQLIGPLVPAEVNKANLYWGTKIYKELLGVVPALAMVNEQTFSRGILSHYKEAGYKAIVMDWNNSCRFHPEWDRSMQYHPQVVKGEGSVNLPVVWSNTIAFQKFQRYIHKEIDEQDYFDYLAEVLKNGSGGFFPVYVGDAEIFDFRPGRYHTEAEIGAHPEWEAIEKLCNSLSSFGFPLVLPSSIVSESDFSSLETIDLTSPEQPIPVKKQEKYASIRWALAGKNNREVNTYCYRIYDELKTSNQNIQSEQWKQLCYFWGSDFRTHIELVRNEKYQEELRAHTPEHNVRNVPCSGEISTTNVIQNGFKLSVSTPSVELILNTRRGLAITELRFPSISTNWLIGSIRHGYYDNVAYSADFYSGHTLAEVFGGHKVADLNNVIPIIKECGICVEVGAVIKTSLGTIEKTYQIFRNEPRVRLSYNFDIRGEWSSFRSGKITLNPEAFDIDSLFYSCTNGGNAPEKFLLKNANDISFGPISFSLSSPGCLGNTTGRFEIGDAKKKIILTTDLSESAALPVMHYVPSVDGRPFIRVAYSFGEFDDTRIGQPTQPIKTSWSLDIKAE